jgi:hypothetical protein
MSNRKLVRRADGGLDLAEVLRATDVVLGLTPAPKGQKKPTKQHIRAIEDHLTVTVRPDQVLLAHEAALETGEAGFWQWVVEYIKARKSKDGLHPLDEEGRRMLRKLARRDRCPQRFLFLPYEIRKLVINLVIDAFFEYLDSQGDESKLQRRGSHSHHLVNVRLVAPDDPSDPDVYVKLPKFHGVVRCRASHPNLTEYLYSRKQRFKGWHLWKNPHEDVWKLTPSFHRLDKPLKPKPVKPRMQHDYDKVLVAVYEEFDATGAIALTAEELLVALAKVGIKLTDNRELKAYMRGVAPRQTKHGGFNRNRYFATDVYQACVDAGIYDDMADWGLPATAGTG